MVQDHRAVLVQDEFEIENPCELTWGMTTDAKIDIKEKGVTELTIREKKLVARVLLPVVAEFTVESAGQKPPEKTNKGARRLIVRLPEARGSVRLAILLSPVWPDGTVNSVRPRALAEW